MYCCLRRLYLLVIICQRTDFTRGNFYPILIARTWSPACLLKVYKDKWFGLRSAVRCVLWALLELELLADFCSPAVLKQQTVAMAISNSQFCPIALSPSGSTFAQKLPKHTVRINRKQTRQPGSVCTPRIAKGRTVRNGIRSTGRLTEKRTPEVRTGLTRAVIHTA